MAKAARKGMVIGMEFFSGKMKKEQMSGRPFLQTQTGALKRSWFIRSRLSLGKFSVTLASRSKYVMMHQQTGRRKRYNSGIIRPKTKDYLTFKVGKQWVNTKKVKIPKRLYLFESFRIEARGILRKHIKEALAGALR